MTRSAVRRHPVSFITMMGRMPGQRSALISGGSAAGPRNVLIMPPSERSSIDMLHDRLFGFVPPTDGTAYERLTAVVLAFLGWQQVAQGSREQREAVEPDK